MGRFIIGQKNVAWGEIKWVKWTKERDQLIKASAKFMKYYTALVFLGASAVTSFAQAETPVTETISEETNKAINLPNGDLPNGATSSTFNPSELLSKSDIELYQQVFVAQEKGQWKKAERLSKKIQNKILIGHVLHQKYFHKRYRSRFSELSAWMAKFADHPGARRLYRLARKRQGRNRRPNLPIPIVISQGVIETAEGAKTAEAPKTSKYKKDERIQIQRLRSNVRRHVRRGNPERAEKRIWAFERLAILPSSEIDELLATVSRSYYFEGQDAKAYALSSYASERSRASTFQPDWIAGLSAWRQGNYTDAATHFEYVADNPNTNTWYNGAGAFWAARSYLVNGNPEKSSELLLKAAGNHHTFYGIIASRQLGIPIAHNWGKPPLSQDQYQKIISEPGVQRAIALTQIGKKDMADEEMRLVWHRYGKDRRRALMALAAHLNLPASQLLLSYTAPTSMEVPDSTLFPVPDWEPADGFKVDKALFFGWMRQESKFMNRANSRVGAVGLMQLMPNTASFIMRDRSLRWSSGRKRLQQPEINMQVAQKYILYLMGLDPSGEDLFRFAISYNGGPGNMVKWEKASRHGGDPLLFIESIPAFETRDFIEKVISNMWMYRDRFNQPSPSLDAVASGAWPYYERLDISYPAKTRVAAPLTHSKTASNR